MLSRMEQCQKALTPRSLAVNYQRGLTANSRRFDPSQFDGQTPGSPDVSSDGNNDVDDGTASTDEGKKIDGTNLSAMGFGRYRSSSTSLIKNLITI